MSLLAVERKEPAEPKSPLLGRLIAGKYRIDAPLAEGGMGAVYLATQLFGAVELGPVVVKILFEEHAADPDRRERFVREARAAREVGSPHVVKVFDFGQDEDGSPYLVMEYLEGRSLYHVLHEQGRLPLGRALHIGIQVASAMMECHKRGILHRDLKPDNLLLLASPSDSSTSDFVKIVDFGIARLGHSGPQVQSLVIGTPRYMAPEQISGKPIDIRVDIFALGVILFEMIAGEPPIPLPEGDGEMAYVTLNLTERPRRLSSLVATVPPSLDRLLLQMMAREPEERPQTMADVRRELEKEALRWEQVLEEQAPEPSPDHPSEGISKTAANATPPERTLETKGRGKGAGMFLVALSVVLLVCMALGLWSLRRQGTTAPSTAWSVPGPLEVVLPDQVPTDEPPPSLR